MLKTFLAWLFKPWVLVAFLLLIVLGPFIVRALGGKVSINVSGPGKARRFESGPDA